MKKWFSQVSASDTKIWVGLYIVVGMVLAYFVAFIYPPKKLLAGAPAMVKWITFGSSAIGLLLGLFVSMYIGYLIYFLLRNILHEEPADKTATKRSFYLTTCISGVLISLIHLVLIIVTGGMINSTSTMVLAVISSIVTAWLIYEFFVQLLKKVKLGRAVALTLFVVNLVPTIMGLF
ncbi:hypothetical protein [Loigolactobacillus zhaoyuanensis]|uniref:Yip1 domain-containing protein n=1 Tax=Loigolactobacillus zhaoyuanensis TaxID=2486017 RepID=A0ABW8UJ09_9LACO|nr:hypothetical protein [Loigolactobacillus zhaoyuanensis]